MNQSDIEINNLIMREIGLEVGPGQCIVDQDTGISIGFHGMNIKAPGAYCGRNSIEFDPHNNKKMMNLLFGYFLDKHSKESDVYVSAFYNVDNGNNTGSIECRMSDQSTIRSKNYKRDSLKCADIITQLNGGSSPNLEAYDTVKESTITKKKRSNKSDKNKSNSKTTKNSR